MDLIKTAFTQLFNIMLLFLTGLAAGQEQKPPDINHSLSYEIGLNRLKEENLFPMVHKGVINGLAYRFERTGRNYNEVSTTLRYGKIKADPETEKVSQNAQFNAGFCSGFRISGGERISLFIGYNVDYSYSFVEFPVWDESRAYWGTSLTIGLSDRLIINDIKENQHWIFSWDINPVGLYSRPDEIRLYAQEIYTFLNIIKTTNSYFRPGFINNILLSDFRTEYRFDTKNDRYFSVQYSLSYSRIKRTNQHPILNSRNNFGICLGF